jgi:hypothetical protein
VNEAAFIAAASVVWPAQAAANLVRFWIVVELGIAVAAEAFAAAVAAEDDPIV